MNVTDEMVEAALDAMFGTPNGSLNSGLMAAIGYSGMYARADRAWCNVYDVSIESDGARIDNREDAMRAALTAALPSAADEPNQWEPTPMVPTRSGFGQEPGFRMAAYWYTFTPTGIKAIDLILSAVACAGKAYHLTEQWTEESEAYHEGLRGECPIDWIQNAANDAAELARKDRPASARPSAGVDDLTLRALDLAQSICDAVPSRLQEVAEEGSWQQRLASLVNVRPDGFHGYAVIRDALDAFKSAPVAPAAEGDAAVDAFMDEVRAELIRARTKFPGDRIMVIALAEEFGELCKAVLDESAANVRKEAVQTAVMAARVALDGDGSVVDWRRERGLDPLVSPAECWHEPNDLASYDELHGRASA